MVSTQSPNAHESFLQAAGERGSTFTYPAYFSELFLFPQHQQILHNCWINGLMLISYESKRLLTCVAQSGLRFAAPLIIPLACLPLPLYVHLHTVLALPGTLLSAVVWFPLCPVGCFCCQSLVGAHPGPFIVDLADPNPVVIFCPGQPGVEMPDLALVLDGHHVRVVLPAPGSSLLPIHMGCRSRSKTSSPQ